MDGPPTTDVNKNWYDYAFGCGVANIENKKFAFLVHDGLNKMIVIWQKISWTIPIF